MGKSNRFIVKLRQDKTLRHDRRNKAKAIALSRKAEMEVRARHFLIALGGVLLLALLLGSGQLTGP